jgi:uncharacterized membrane protein
LLKTKQFHFLLLFGALLGLVLCLVLWWIGLSEDPVLGCGAGGCGAVLGTRWAKVFRIPVAWYAAFFYAVWVACEFVKIRGHRVWFAGAAAGAALWFIVVQAFILKAFCPWCMSVHTVGLFLGGLVLIADGQTALKRFLPVGLASCLGLGLAQVYGPRDPSHLMEVMDGKAGEIADSRYVSFDGGKIRFSLDEYPRLGTPSAKHVVVELFDYQCISCRVMSGYAKALVEAYPEQVSVLLVPVPMDSACNHFLAGGGHYEGSCAISRIALALWAAQPASFGDFHEALMSDPSEALARDLALAFMDQAQIDAALKDEHLQSLLEANIRTWKRLSGTSSSLPKLLVSDRRVLHGLPASRKAFLEIMKTELSLE